MAAQQTADRRLVGRPSPKFGKFCNDMLFIKKMMKNILFFFKKKHLFARQFSEEKGLMWFKL
jgi:hypothetical protein